MKSWLIKFTLIIIAAFLLLRFSPALPISSTISQKQELFTVTGEGKVTVVPDVATTNLGITVTRPTAKSAQTEANSVINKISTSLKNLGVGERDIQTTNYSIYPQYDRSGYTININLTVTVRDLEKINQVIDTATTNGANSIGGINLTVDEKRQKELLQQARNEAIKEAREKAQSLASTAGMTLGKIVNIQESQPGLPVFLERAVSLQQAGGGDTQIQPGSTDIVSTITLFYETR